MAEAPALDGVTDLHIDLPAVWDTMWISYFLREKQLTLENVSYWPVSSPTGDLWVQRINSGPPARR